VELRGEEKMKIMITEKFDMKETKRKLHHYFMDLERLEWEQARLNIQQGLTSKHDENQRQDYVTVGKDEFNLLAKDEKNEEVEKYLASYNLAKSILSKDEQQYITEYFVNKKREDELADLFYYSGSDSRAFRDLKRRAVYKFAYVLNLVV